MLGSNKTQKYLNFYTFRMISVMKIWDFSFQQKLISKQSVFVKVEYHGYPKSSYSK